MNGGEGERNHLKGLVFFWFFTFFPYLAKTKIGVSSYRNRRYMYKGITLAVIKLIDLSSSRWYDPIDQIVTDHKSFLKVLSSFQWVELQCRDDFHVWLFEQWLCPCVRFLVLPGLGKLKVVVPCTHEMYVHIEYC